jgi:hypothetical protein
MGRKADALNVFKRAFQIDKNFYRAKDLKIKELE